MALWVISMECSLQESTEIFYRVFHFTQKNMRNVAVHLNYWNLLTRSLQNNGMLTVFCSKYTLKYTLTIFSRGCQLGRFVAFSQLNEKKQQQQLLFFWNEMKWQTQKYSNNVALWNWRNGNIYSLGVCVCWLLFLLSSHWMRIIFVSWLMFRPMSNAISLSFSLRCT